MFFVGIEEISFKMIYRTSDAFCCGISALPRQPNKLFILQMKRFSLEVNLITFRFNFEFRFVTFIRAKYHIELIMP